MIQPRWFHDTTNFKLKCCQTLNPINRINDWYFLSQVWSVSYNPDGDKIISVSEDKNVLVYDAVCS